MRIQVAGSCTDACGVRVRGEIDTANREFLHWFSFPRGAEALIRERPTEVEGVRLATFAPAEVQWSVACPLCGSRIAIGGPST